MKEKKGEMTENTTIQAFSEVYSIINHLDNKQYKFNIKIYLGTIIATFISNIGPLYSIIVSPKEKHKTAR